MYNVNCHLRAGCDLEANSVDSPFGCRYSATEFRIGIGQLDYRCLDVQEFGTGI